MQKAKTIVHLIQEVKGKQIIMFDVQGQSSITDFVITCEGNSQAHVRGIADKVEENLKKLSVRNNGVEGYSEGSWILMDYDEVIVHIFHPETRNYYRLEEIHSSCPTETYEDEEAATL